MPPTPITSSNNSRSARRCQFHHVAASSLLLFNSSKNPYNEYSRENNLIGKLPWKRRFLVRP